MSFLPPLSTTTFVPLPSASSSPSSKSLSRTLYFTYLPSPSSLTGDALPEIWTNLPSSPGDEAWHALPFSPTTNPESTGDAKIYTASVDLSNLIQPQSFEYTYRLRHASGDVEWLGSTGSNGKIEVVASPPSSSTAPKFEDVGGRWKTLEEGVVVGAFESKKGESGSVEEFDVTALLGDGEEGWAGGEGVVWEQSSYVP
jgi:hypothetical protein